MQCRSFPLEAPRWSRSQSKGIARMQTIESGHYRRVIIICGCAFDVSTYSMKYCSPTLRSASVKRIWSSSPTPSPAPRNENSKLTDSPLSRDSRLFVAAFKSPLNPNITLDTGAPRFLKLNLRSCRSPACIPPDPVATKNG